MKTMSFNSGRQAAMVQFYNALGANLVAKQVQIGSNTFQGHIGDIEIAIYGIPTAEKVHAPNVSLRFEIDDLAAALEILSGLPEVRVLMDPSDMPTGKQAIVLDPDGRSVELFQPWPQT